MVPPVRHPGVGRPLCPPPPLLTHSARLGLRLLPGGAAAGAFTGPRRRSAESGFTLVELFAACIIISIVATLAIPAVTKQMRDRRARLVAEQIADQYRTARMRALSRGGAVMLRITAGTAGSPATIELREAVQGGAADDANSYMPVSSCTLTTWTMADLATITGFSASRQLLRYVAPAGSGAESIVIEPRDTTNSAVDSVSVCFTPMGRAFFSVDRGASWTQLAGVASARVYRGSSGVGSTPIGMERVVVLLPNGSARLGAIAVDGTP